MAIGIRQRGGAVVDERRKGGSKRPLWSPSLKEKDLTEGMDEESLAIAAEADSPEQQRLDAAGIRTPTYERPSFFTNLLSGGAAGRQADDANTQSLRYKNDLLARQAELSEAQRQENARLDKTHGWNTEAATVAHDRAAQMEDKRAQIALEAGNAGVLTGKGILYDPSNKDIYNKMVSPEAIQAAQTGFGLTTSANQLGTKRNALGLTQLNANPAGFMDSLTAAQDKQGIDNDTARENLLQSKTLFPLHMQDQQGVIERRNAETDRSLEELQRLRNTPLHLGSDGILVNPKAGITLQPYMADRNEYELGPPDNFGNRKTVRVTKPGGLGAPVVTSKLGGGEIEWDVEPTMRKRPLVNQNR